MGDFRLIFKILKPTLRLNHSLMDTTSPAFISIAGLIVLVIFLVFAIFFLRKFIRDINQGRGPMGSTIQQTRATAQESIGIAKESVEVAREILRNEKELLATQKEMNE
jgi:hypothetical protein